MTREEAIERIKARFDKWALDDEDMKAIQTLVPELRESEDERIIRAIIDALYSHTNSINLLSSRGYQMGDIEAWLEKQKECLADNNKTSTDEDERIRKEINILYSDIDACITELLKARTDKDSESEGKALFKMEGLMVATLQDLSCIEDYLEKQKETSINWMKSDNVKNPDKPYIDKAGMFYTTDGRMCYASEIEKQRDENAKDSFERGIRVGMIRQQKEQKPIKWTDLTWKDIVELEGIINNVHYDFSAGIGQESFGKEVLERFRSTKGIEYLDEAEQKCWRIVLPQPHYAFEEGQKEQKHTLKFKVGDKVHMEGDDSVILTITEIKEDRYLTDCGPILFGAEDIWQIVEQWSEEDRHNLNSVISLVHNTTDGAWGSCIGDRIETWLKSLPERFNLQSKQEWSEEDEKMRENIISDLRYFRDCETDEEAVSDYDDEIAWLKDISLNHKKFTEAVYKLWSNDWSDEDKEALDMCLDAIPKRWKTKSGILLTKWLKDNIHLQLKQEWSDEDKEMLECVIMDVESAKKNYLKSTTEVVRQGAIIADKELAWLKALRPSWKPSKEQMEALRKLMKYAVSLSSYYDIQKEIESLYNDLNKLK